MKRTIIIITVTVAFMAGAMTLGVATRSGMLARALWLGRTVRIVSARVIPVAQADILPPSDHALFINLLKNIGISNPEAEISLRDIFGGNNHNLYLYFYQQLKLKPGNDALIKTSQRYGLTPSELELVLAGSVEPLQRRHDGTYTLERGLREVTAIQQAYASMLRDIRQRTMITADVEPTEIFANGSLDDSGFDLIHDLDLIEQILFVDESKTMLNQHPFSSGGGGGGSKSGGKSGSGNVGASVGGASGGATVIPGSNGAKLASGSSSAAAAKPASQSTINQLISGAMPPSNATVSNNICLATSPLSTALTAYDSTLPKGTATNGTTNGAANSAKTAPATSGTAPSALSIDQIPLPDFDTLPATPAAPTVYPADNICDGLAGSTIYKASTSHNGINEDYACITFALHNRTYSAYYPGQSCIQCMITGMNQSMDKLLRNPLSPNKLTGNLLEPAKCKSAGGSSSFNLVDRLDLNIFFIPVPIITPSKYDALTKVDLGKVWDRFERKYMNFSNAERPPDQTRRQSYGSQLYDRAVAESYQDLGPVIEQDRLLSEINSRVAAEQNRALNESTLAEFEDSADSSGSSYQLVIAELRTMTSYFAAFNNLFNQIVIGPCDALLQKPDINS